MSEIGTVSEGGRSMIRGSLISLAVRVVDLPSRYGFHLLVAAALGVARTGDFYIVFSMMVVLAGFGRIGIDQALMRQIAIDVASAQPAAVRPTIRRALRHVLLASALVSALLAASAVAIASHLLKKPELAVPLMLGAISFVPQNIGAVLAGALAGLQRVGWSQMIYSWLWPAIFCAVAIPMGFAGAMTVTHALVLIAVSFVLTAMVGAALLRRFLGAVPDTGAPPLAPPRLLMPGVSLFTLEFTKLLMTSAPAIALGIVASSRETGLFALAWRLALVVNLLISGVAGMAAPRFASLFARRDLDALRKSAAQAVGLVLCIALPLVLGMLLVPERLLMLFGPGYGAGAAALRVLALGQLAAACFTAMPELLGMTAHTSVLYRVNALSTAILVIALAALAPAGGSIGAAVATSLAIAVNGGTAAFAARRLLGVAPLAMLWRGAISRLRMRSVG